MTTSVTGGMGAVDAERRSELKEHERGLARSNAATVERAGRVLMQNYRQQPIVLARGAGALLWDLSGKRYIDMTAGVAVCSLGHAHPRLVRTIAEQASRLLHVSNLYYSEPQIELAEELVRRSFADRVFFCNSGAEANEAALKLARRYHAVTKGAPERTEIVAFEGSFHGRTSGAVSMTGQPKYRAGFGPLVGPVRFLPFDDVHALESVDFTKVCAIFVEPVQGEGGVLPASEGFLKALRAYADASGAVLVFDEVQTGFGRTGRLFGYEHVGVRPDVMTLAKGIAGGVPMGAIVARDEFARALEPGTHASTFGGNALASAAGLAVLAAFDEEKLVERAERVGRYLGDKLAVLAEKYAPRTRGARGLGLMRGLVLEGDAASVFSCRSRAGRSFASRLRS
jgi:predicted acetylornithine/succinylornithine family transaminase